MPLLRFGLRLNRFWIYLLCQLGYRGIYRGQGFEFLSPCMIVLTWGFPRNNVFLTISLLRCVYSFPPPRYLILPSVSDVFYDYTISLQYGCKILAGYLCSTSSRIVPFTSGALGLTVCSQIHISYLLLTQDGRFLLYRIIHSAEIIKLIL